MAVEHRPGQEIMAVHVYSPSATGPVYAGFPRALAGVLRCPSDGSELALQGPSAGDHVTDGALACAVCGHVLPIVAGIVRLLAAETFEKEEQHEIALRDSQARTLARDREFAYWASPYSRLETSATLRALDPAEGHTALDLGCGTGRYTRLLAVRCRAVLAVDFSLGSLGWLARENTPAPNVGLVHGDITRLRLAPRAFHRVLATTPLDTREQRLAMHHVAADALADEGVYVFSTEHYDLRTRLLGEPRAQRYKPGDNLFFRLTRAEVEREAAPYFARVRARPINVSLPFSRLLPRPLRGGLSRAAERVPLLRQLGDLLLVRARRPIRAPEEGVSSGGSMLFRSVHRLWRKAATPEP